MIHSKVATKLHTMHIKQSDLSVECKSILLQNITASLLDKFKISRVYLSSVFFNGQHDMLPFSRLSVLMNLLSANLHHGCQRCVIYYGFFPLVEKMGLNIETVVMVTNVNNAGGRLK